MGKNDGLCVGTTDGSSVSCDVRSLLFYGLSAVQGNSDSYLRVGDFYYYGKAGISQNKASAVKYYQLASNQRNSHAIFNLGLMYEIGDTMSEPPKDDKNPMSNMLSELSKGLEDAGFIWS